MLSYEFTLDTQTQNFYNITSKVTQAIRLSEIKDGICIVYCPHTTAGITINENADPDVVSDMLIGLSKAFPDRPEYRHMEGNTTAHLKATIVGSSATIIIENGYPVLGRWQGVYFCEFDGPRKRRFIVKVMGEK